MTPSDDEVVGKVQVETIHGTYGDQLVETEVFEPVHFRDLERHIQDRLRAADELADAHEPHRDPPGPDFLDWVADRLVYVHGEDESLDFVHALRRRAKNARAALAAYEATFKEADT